MLMRKRFRALVAAAMFAVLPLTGCSGKTLSSAHSPVPTVPVATRLGNGVSSASVFVEPSDKRTPLTNALCSVITIYFPAAFPKERICFLSIRGSAAA
jgi:hypothetical protein